MVAKPDDDLEKEKQADYGIFTLTGNHYEIGRQWGWIGTGRESDLVTQKEAVEVAQLLGLSIEQLAALNMGDEAPREEAVEEELLSPSQLAFARDCLQIVSNFHPPLMDEFEGWADALGKGMDSILSMLLSGMKTGSPRCSAFAWRTTEGVIVGRNYDFFYWARTRHLLRTKPVAYYATVGMNDGLLGGRHDGVNEQGLFVALASVMTAEPKRVQPGVIFHLVPRILLETCAGAGEAAMLAREMPHLMSYNYLIADPQEMFVVEAYPGSVRVREAEGNHIAATNHFLHPELQDLMDSPIQENSEQRLSKMVSALEDAEEESDPRKVARHILTDHETPICGHTDGLATLWSMIADLADRRLAYSLGAPCRNQYRDIPWPGGGVGKDEYV
jgi:predicted choloylglycine hydrolase